MARRQLNLMVRRLSALEGAVILCAHQYRRSADQFVGLTPPRRRPHWHSLVVRRRAALRDQTLFGFGVWERLHGDRYITFLYFTTPLSIGTAVCLYGILLTP